MKNHKIASDVKSISLYPHTVDDGKIVIPNSRLAWCFGDLGIATSIWQAGKSLTNLKNLKGRQLICCCIRLTGENYVKIGYWTLVFVTELLALHISLPFLFRN